MTDSWEDAPVPNAVPILPVSDLLRAVAWYGRLGFSVRSLFEDQGYAILGFEGTELHLNLAHGMPGPAETWSGCYLRVADADEVHARWMAVGAREVGGLVERLRRAGALAAAMAGSGAACFGVFASEAAALTAREAVAPVRAWYVTDLQPAAAGA